MKLNKLSISEKVKITNQIIIDWYENNQGRVFVAFSGGFKSTLLLHLVRKLYPDVPAVFIDNELDYPEIKKFVSNNRNVTIIKPVRKYQEMLDKFGYQVVSKEVSENVQSYRNTGSEKALRMLKGILRNGKPNAFATKDWTYIIDAPFKISKQCCYEMKQKPLYKYASENKLAVMKGNISSRAVNISNNSELVSFCNRYKPQYSKTKSYPLYFWNILEIFEYIYKNEVPYAKHFGEIKFRYNNYQKKGTTYYITTKGYNRGCLLCLCNLDKYDREKKFVEMKENYPDYYARAFMYHQYGRVCDFLGYKY